MGEAPIWPDNDSQLLKHDGGAYQPSDIPMWAVLPKGVVLAMAFDNREDHDTSKPPQEMRLIGDLQDTEKLDLDPMVVGAAPVEERKNIPIDNLTSYQPANRKPPSKSSAIQAISMLEGILRPLRPSGKGHK